MIFTAGAFCFLNYETHLLEISNDELPAITIRGFINRDKIPYLLQLKRAEADVALD